MIMEEQYSSNNNNNRDSVVVVVDDRISALPDCILGVILSFLTTKHAVSTSLLSKRWKTAWLDVHNLDLVVHDSAETIPFIRFVHKALRLTVGRPLNKFRLVWCSRSSSISSHVISWIDAAITRNVREIGLYPGVVDLLKVPISGFNCHSLRSLQIDSIFFVFDSNVVCLPRLETLKLSGVRFISEEAFEKLINGCPMLHSFGLTLYSRSSFVVAEKDFMYIVSSPSLRHLDMHIVDRCTLKLNSPLVEYLKLSGRITKIFAEKNLSSLIEADFDTQLNKHDFRQILIVEAVCVLEHAKFLTLSARVMQALSRATISLSTKFKRLVKLVVGPYCSAIQAFILNSENLEHLIIRQDFWPIGTSNPPDHSRWTVPVVVPRCISKSLKKVRLDGYKGLEDEREMIRYMLEYGVALEIMQIHCSSKKDGEKLELLQQICEFPRKSPGCKVQFVVFPIKRKFQLLL